VTHRVRQHAVWSHPRGGGPSEDAPAARCSGLDEATASEPTAAPASGPNTPTQRITDTKRPLSVASAERGRPELGTPIQRIPERRGVFGSRGMGPASPAPSQRQKC